MEAVTIKWPNGRPIQAGSQLLVEGRTAEIFFREWIEALGFKNQIEVRDYGSLEDLTPYLKVFTGYKAFREFVTAVAIIRDAEDKLASVGFDSVCAALNEVGLPCPQNPCSFSEGLPRVGVFVLPDCEKPGMLETLCWSALESNEKLRPQLECVGSYLDCIKTVKAPPRNVAKARVWTYLAGKGQFDPQVGRAAQAKVWDWENPAFKPLSEFLTTLAGQ